ncbi:MjaI family restriction endonuclease [[Clostridium] aminophilum]|uniref:MjaI family restriction endonuclease n=1 Tax=[Clostridium] aminophilum TaxID=1526 RepID=UPI0026EA0C60|nr:MjaI family restriction endonuclease [[Clostridium] aminophilum]MDD6196533.1 MjaI family restriction endonuclease [[Clostridium] aminophilum]
MKFEITKKEIEKAVKEVYGSSAQDYPKYSTQIMNLANQNAGGTRPRVVGQLSELFPEFQASGLPSTIESWEKWYSEKYPNAIDTATDRVYEQICNLRNVLPIIDKKMVHRWVKDLVINKTFYGLSFQQIILASYAKRVGAYAYRIADPNDESKGIDGYVNDIPFSVKPITYKEMNRLPEQIPYKMIYYVKTSNGDLQIDVED